MTQNYSSAPRISHVEAREFARRAFVCAGVSDTQASAAAEVLVWASLRGIDTHGLRNLKRYYIDGLHAGTIKADAEFRLLEETNIAATVDGGCGLGLSVSHRAMMLAIAKATDSGVGIVAVRNSQHFGAAGHYAHLAVGQEMIGACASGYFFHNGQETAVLPFGGLLPMLSTNPLAFACPAESLPAFVLDLSTSVVPVNRLELMQELGKSIPPGWGLDTAGEATTDPSAVKKLLPLGGAGQLGGHKGYGLALAVQILTGVLSTAWRRNPEPERILGERKTIGADGYAQEGIGHLFAALRIDQFGSVDRFKHSMDAMIRTLNNSPAAAGHERVVVPGQLESETEQIRRKKGIPLNEPTVADLKTLAAEFNLPLRIF